MSFLASLFQMDIPVARITLYNLTFVNSDTIKYREVAPLKILFFTLMALKIACKQEFDQYWKRRVFSIFRNSFVYWHELRRLCAQGSLQLPY